MKMIKGTHIINVYGEDIDKFKAQGYIPYRNYLEMINFEPVVMK